MEFKSWKAFGYKVNEVALEVNDGHCPYIFTLGTATHLHRKSILWSVGDRLRLHFDFTERKCSAFYNGDFLGVLSEDLPRKLYLAASLLYANSSFECTLFELL